MKDINKNDVLTNVDDERLEKVESILEKMIDAVTDNGNFIPSNIEKLEVLKGIADSLNSSIVRKVKIKQQIKKDQEDTDNEARKIAIMKDVAKRRMERQKQIQQENRVVVDTLPDNLVPTDILPGELDTIPSELDINDFVGDNDE